MGYTKLHSSILDSTIWDHELHVKITWITMLAMSDRDGVISASVPGLAKRAGVSRSQCEDALAIITGPDPDSRSTELDGRRAVIVQGGWRLVNHMKYRHLSSTEDIREKGRIRQQRHRDRLRQSVTDGHTPTNADKPSVKEAVLHNDYNGLNEAVTRYVTPHTQNNYIAIASAYVSDPDPDPEKRSTPTASSCPLDDDCEPSGREDPWPVGEPDAPRWTMAALCRLISARRQAAGGGPYSQSSRHYQALDEAAELFRELDPVSPEAAARFSLDRWAESQWARDHGWPVAAWLADPGKWIPVRP